MSPVCPQGHQSSTTDYCDQCGALMSLTLGNVDEEEPVETSAAGSGPRPDPGSRAMSGEPCPSCGTPRSGDDRFCEDCGFDFATGAAHAPASAPALWELVVTADRAYFEQMAAEGVEFPTDYLPRRFELACEEMRLGRRRPAAGPAPEINLAGAAEDPAISHLQARFVRQRDGSYVVIDPGSTNGMTINDDPHPIEANVAVPLADGDHLRLGAWTKITVRQCPAGSNQQSSNAAGD